MLLCSFLVLYIFSAAYTYCPSCVLELEAQKVLYGKGNTCLGFLLYLDMVKSCSLICFFFAFTFTCERWHCKCHRN